MSMHPALQQHRMVILKSTSEVLDKPTLPKNMPEGLQALTN